MQDGFRALEGILRWSASRFFVLRKICDDCNPDKPPPRSRQDSPQRAYNPSDMNPLENLWHWLVVNWSPLGIGAVLGGCVGFGFNVFKWFVPSRADLMRGREEAKTKKIDASVFNSLLDPKLPRSSHGISGRGLPLTRASEIATHLEIELDAVEDSLMRLEDRGRVDKDYGLWFAIPH